MTYQASSSPNGVDSWIAQYSLVQSLVPKCYQTLSLFYETSDGFRAKEKDVGVKILSHALSVEASLALPPRSLVPYLEIEERKKQLEIFLKNDWTISRQTNREEKEDAYTTSVALPSMTRLLKSLGQPLEKHVPRVNKALATLRDRALQLDRTSSTPWNHALFLYNLRRAFDCIEKDWVPVLAAYTKTAPAKYVEDQLREPLEKLRKEMETRLYYHLSMCTAIPENDEDALQLGYLVFSLHVYDHFPNEVLVGHAIDTSIKELFKAEVSPRIQTIYRDNKLNISCSPFEMLTLFAGCRRIQRSFPEYAPAFHAAYEWIESTVREAPVFPVWMAEPWRGVTEPEAWVNAHVIQFLIRYADLLKSSCGAKLLVDYGANIDPPSVTWNQVIDSFGFKSELTNGLIEPGKLFKGHGKLKKASVLLFGPPGTAKTTIARAIAWELQWPYIEIPPSLFAEEGVEGVIRNARGVFERIQLLNRCVVLFDEVDELVATRTGEVDKIGRFITTSMLPWLQRLRDNAQIVFIATTNHISNFDAAIKRPGRFDFVLPVGVPDPQYRQGLIGSFLKSSGASAQVISEVAKLIDAAIADVKLSTIDSQSDAAKAVEVSWPATLGEIKVISDHVQRFIVDGCAPKDIPIASIVSRIGLNPLITAVQSLAFEKDARAYKFPPSVEDL